MNGQIDYANEFNRIAGGQNLASQEVPLTISTRGAQSGAMHNMGMLDLASRHRRNQIMRQFQLEQARKAQEAGPMDFLGLIPGIGGIIRGMDDRGAATKTMQAYDYK